jgi:hypothetical protein
MFLLHRAGGASTTKESENDCRNCEYYEGNLANVL